MYGHAIIWAYWRMRDRLETLTGNVGQPRVPFFCQQLRILNVLPTTTTLSSQTN